MHDVTLRMTFEQLEEFMADVFIGLGVPEPDARICAAVLIESDKRGIESHGINRMKPIYYDRIRKGLQNPVTNFEVVKDTVTTAVVDGHNGMGHVIAKRAMDLAIAKAKTYNLGMVAVRNSTHYGIAGYYPMMAIKEGMIGITGTNARPSVAPTFGVEGYLGTNPLTFGIPTDEPCNFVLDCATSVSQRGKVELYARLNKQLPDGWVLDSKGESMNDPHQVLDELKTGAASFVPLGGIGEEHAGYKGYGYSTVVELLSAALQSGSYLRMLSGFTADGKPAPILLGHFFIAINVAAFVELAEFQKTAGAIIRELRACKKAPGQDHIFTAGEKEYNYWLAHKDQGIPVNKSLQNDILTMQRELNLTKYSFPFSA